MVTDETYAAAERLITAARKAGIMIATAESCTGGMIGAAITAVSGSSDVYHGGYVTYAYTAKKHMLGVKQETLDVHGAVSAETAREMVEGLYEAVKGNFDPDKEGSKFLCLSVTGVAGPDDSEGKPAGTVWFAIRTTDGTVIPHLENFKGDPNDIRTSVRHQSTLWALTNLEKSI